MASGAEVVQEAYEAFSRGDIPAVLGGVADDAEWTVSESLVHGGSWRGPDGAGEFFKGLGETFDDISVEITDLIDGGDQVVGVGISRGTRGGNAVEYGFAHVFTVADGKVTRFREYADSTVE